MRISFNLEDCFPDGYSLSESAIIMASDNVPVTAMIGGKKAQIGSARIVQESGKLLAIADIEESNPVMAIFRDRPACLFLQEFTNGRGLVEICEFQVKKSSSYSIGVSESYIERDMLGIKDERSN